MKRALIITYYWPPAGGSGVQRWVKFSKYLPSLGWQPVIYTPENPQVPFIDRSLDADVPEEAEVIRRPITEFYDIYRKFMGRKGGSGAGEVNPINSRSKTPKEKLTMTIRGNLFIPDPKITWRRPSVRFLTEYLRRHPVDVIISTGPPHSMHLIAMDVARRTGLPWIADFRDPWTKIFYFKYLMLSRWADRKHHKMEKEVLDSASAVVAVSPLVQEDFRKMTSTPVSLITNGYDPEDFDQVVEPDGYFNLSHVGLLAADGNPLTLWRVLSKLASRDPEFASMLRIRLVGKTDVAVLESIAKAGLGKNLVNLGYKPHEVAVREEKGASMLLLTLRKESEYKAVLPGKLFEYLASRRPVLGIGQKDGAMASILAGTGAGRTYGWGDEEMEEYISECWEAWKKGDPMANGHDISGFSRAATARQMVSLMESLINKAR